MFLINRDSSKVILFELTVPWDMNINGSHDLKSRKYASLRGDLEHQFSVSIRGFVSKANKARLKSFLLNSTGLRRASAVSLITNVSKAALLGSFSIFSARNESMWNVGRDLSVNI